MNRHLPVPPRTEYYTQRLHDLSNVLSDTNENINEIDRELTRTRIRKKYPETSIADNYYESSAKKNHNKKYKLKPSVSDTEDEYMVNSRQSRGRHNVVFRDDLNESLHELHQQVRDLSFEHDKLADHFHSEMGRSKHDKRYIDSQDSSSTLEKRMEMRFANVLEKMKSEKTEDHLRDEIKTTLEEFRKVSKDDITQLKLTMMETDKQKVENELLITKQRLLEIEESKTSLSSQVQQLRDQLNKFENNNIQSHNIGRHLPSCGVNKGSDKSCKCCIEKEIESLKHEIHKSKYNVDSPNEVVRAIEKYEKQKEILADHNQSLRKLVEEKEAHENQLNLELKMIFDKNDKLDKHNSKLQMDLEMALAKLQEITQEAEKYANALRNAEEQLNISEFKRNELKQDAQETVKLWKAKVKKLEKSLDKYKSESMQLGEQNDQLKTKHNSYGSQLECKTKEVANLKELNGTIEEKLNVREIELNHFKILCDEIRNQNESLKNELNELKVNNKQYENRIFNIQTEKADLEREFLIETEKYRDILERYTAFENDIAIASQDRKQLEMYASKMEQECQRLKATLSNLKEAGNAAKNDLNSVSMQAIHNKESYEDKMNKMNRELQKAQFQLQKVKIECEDSIRLSQVQIAEEKSKIELFKKRENEYLKEIDELKEARRKFEDDLIDLQSNYEKLSRNDNDKNKQILDHEEKISKMISDMSEQKTTFYNKESEYWQILNTLNVDMDLMSGLISTNANELYKPINIIDDTEKDKARSFYLLIKSKINWIGKEVEVQLQKTCKLQQTVSFLEHELDNVKKKSASNSKTTDLFIQKLENQANSLEAEKSLAFRNMELLNKYLMSLSESLKTHSLKEIERTHHLIAVDNVLNICNNEKLYESGKEGIFERFKQFTNSINDIKCQLQAAKLDDGLGAIKEPIGRSYTTKFSSNINDPKRAFKSTTSSRLKTVNKI